MKLFKDEVIGIKVQQHIIKIGYKEITTHAIITMSDEPNGEIHLDVSNGNPMALKDFLEGMTSLLRLKKVPFKVLKTKVTTEYP